MPEVVTIGDATLYCGDCLEILPTLPKVDAVITDPPYGVGIEYASFNDTRQAVADLASAWLPLAQQGANRVAFTSGVVQQWIYPEPDWVVAWFQGAGGARGNWGFSMWQPILCYGKDPFLERCAGARPDTIYTALSSTGVDKSVHPCPKPIEVWMRVIDRCSAPAGAVADPFMGSGTTGVACVRLGRKFIGIELEPRYFDIACKRIEQAHAQGRLFEPASPTQPSQTALL